MNKTIDIAAAIEGREKVYPDVNKGRSVQFYNHENPMPQEMLDNLKTISNGDQKDKNGTKN